MTVIKQCKCQHEFQDQRYGKGNRVHNTCRPEGKARCTVCKDVK